MIDWQSDGTAKNRTLNHIQPPRDCKKGQANYCIILIALHSLHDTRELDGRRKEASLLPQLGHFRRLSSKHKLRMIWKEMRGKQSRAWDIQWPKGMVAIVAQMSETIRKTGTFTIKCAQKAKTRMHNLLIEQCSRKVQSL